MECRTFTNVKGLIARFNITFTRDLSYIKVFNNIRKVKKVSRRFDVSNIMIKLKG